MEENETGFEEFDAGLFGDEYHDAPDSDVDTVETETEEADDTLSEASEEPESGENPTDESAEEVEEAPTEEGSEPESKANEQMFEYKVNKEARKLNLADEQDRATARELMQKGSDYDRVKEQSAQRQKTIESMQEQITALSGNQHSIDVLSMIAEKSGSKMDELVEQLYINFRRSGGASEDAARAELENLSLQKQLDAVNAEKEKQKETESDNDARFRRDVEEFQREYPDIPITNELVEKLVPDIQNGLSLTAAYRKSEQASAAEKTAALEKRIQELEHQLEAAQQNAKNKKKSPGSQVDSGGRRSKSDFEVFEAALFG